MREERRESTSNHNTGGVRSCVEVHPERHEHIGANNTRNIRYSALVRYINVANNIELLREKILH